MESLNSILEAFISTDNSKININNNFTLEKSSYSFVECSSFWQTIPGVSFGAFRNLNLLVESARPIFMLEMDFEIAANPGDTFAIYAPNDDTLVEKLISLLALPSDLKILKESPVKAVSSGTNPAYIEFSKGNVSIPISYLLKYVLDIKNPVSFLKKSFLSFLSKHIHPGEKQRFIEFVTLQGKESSFYYNQLLLTRVDLFTFLSWIYTDIFQNNQTIVPIAKLIDFLSPISARQYSLSFVKDDQTISIVFNKENNGHCTTWLSFLTSIGTIIPLIYKPAISFHPPKELNSSIIMIAHGTGIAPFLSFLQYFSRQNKKDTHQTQIKKTIWLIYGCRNSDYFLFRSEINKFLSENILTKLSVCFSRPLDDSSCHSEYIQDAIWKEKDFMREIMLKGASPPATIYICGDESKMVPEVLLAISHSMQDVIESPTDCLIKEWTASRRILREVWR